MTRPTRETHNTRNSLPPQIDREGLAQPRMEDRQQLTDEPTRHTSATEKDREEVTFVNWKDAPIRASALVVLMAMRWLSALSGEVALALFVPGTPQELRVMAIAR